MIYMANNNKLQAIALGNIKWGVYDYSVNAIFHETIDRLRLLQTAVPPWILFVDFMHKFFRMIRIYICIPVGIEYLIGLAAEDCIFKKANFSGDRGDEFPACNDLRVEWVLQRYDGLIYLRRWEPNGSQ